MKFFPLYRKILAFSEKYLIDDFKSLRKLLSFRSMQRSRLLVILKEWMFAATDFDFKRRTKSENEFKTNLLRRLWKRDFFIRNFFGRNCTQTDLNGARDRSMCKNKQNRKLSRESMI